jgi:hypothetical protein
MGVVKGFSDASKNAHRLPLFRSGRSAMFQSVRWRLASACAAPITRAQAKKTGFAVAAQE